MYHVFFSVDDANFARISEKTSSFFQVIGCIIGFSVAAKGIESVNWNETKNIFISWVAAPLLTGAVGFFIFLFIQRFILLSNNPFHRGYYTFSFILFFSKFLL